MKAMIAWFARNTVAANLLMILILGGGALTVSKLRMEIFPEFSADMVSVSVVYPISYKHLKLTTTPNV